MSVDILNPLEIRDWNERIGPMGGACFFHCAEWAATLHEAYGFRPMYFAHLDGSDLRACLPLMSVKSALTGRRGVSLPFSDFCPPLRGTGSDTVAEEELVAAAHESAIRSRWRYVEWRGAVAVKPRAAVFREYLTHTVTLDGNAQALFARFKSEARTAVRKAEKAGLRLVVSRSADSLTAFYRMHCLTRREHGLPPPPAAFFRAFYRHVLTSGLGCVVLAEREGVPIAGAVFTHLGRQALFKYGASDKRHQSLRAGNLVMWEGLRIYGQEGYAEMNLGRTSPSHAGLLRFKRSWGPNELRIAYYRFDPATSRYEAGHDEREGFMNLCFRRFPMPLLKICGRLLYKHAA